MEAAHRLDRGDLESLDGMDFRGFLGSAAVSEVDFAVYKDLRDRGFYLSPAREGWPGVADAAGADFLVYPRGKGPWDGEVEHRVRVVGERETASPLSGRLRAGGRRRGERRDVPRYRPTRGLRDQRRRRPSDGG